MISDDCAVCTQNGILVFDFWQEDFIRLSDHVKVVKELQDKISLYEEAAKGDIQIVHNVFP